MNMNSPLLFHCTICYEALNGGKHAPVVLPCGHTFVCQKCSLRLEKCMECRYPLFQQVKSTPQKIPPDEINIFSSLIPPRIPLEERKLTEEIQRKQLPMPKNFVLISLIESSLCVRETNKSSDDIDEREWYEKGIEQFKSTSGTFVVRDPNGLSICGKKAEKNNAGCTTEMKEKAPDFPDLTEVQSDTLEFDMDFGNALRINSNEGSLDLNDIANGDEIKSNSDERNLDLNDAANENDSEEGSLDLNDITNENNSDDGSLDLNTTMNNSNDNRLEYGNTVQVVNFKDGVAKLARGSGTLKVTSKQLIRVGNVQDEACRLEGTIFCLKKQREETENQVKAIDKSVKRLTAELSEALLVPFTNPVFKAPQANKANMHKSCPEIAFDPGTPGTLSCTNSPSSDDLSMSQSISSTIQMPTLRSSSTCSPARVSTVNFRSGMSGHRGATARSSRYSRRSQGVRFARPRASIY